MAAMARMVVVAVMVGMVRTDCGTTMESATFGDFRRCSSREVKASLQSQASCSPRPMVVRLPWPNSTMVGGGVRQMTPTHVTVMQCGGGCHRGSQGCLPTSTRQRQVSVMVGKCGVSVGKCDKECAVVRVEEHTQCGCGCQLERATCEAKGLHRFREEVCSCECREVEGKRRCLEQGRTWEEETCTCGCPAVLSCTSGNTYSSTTCMCEPVDTHLIAGKEDRSPRSNTGSIFSGEIIIIGVLLGLIFIMLIIIFSLINKLQSVRRRIKLRQLTAEAQNNVDIYSELGKKDAMLKPKEQSYGQLYCDSPSSGFASRSGSTKYSEGEGEGSPEPCQECLYQSAESVRVNKRLHGCPPSLPPVTSPKPPRTLPPTSPAPPRTLERRCPATPGTISQYGELRVAGEAGGFSTTVTRQIDEAVRLLQSSAAEL